MTKVDDLAKRLDALEKVVVGGLNLDLKDIPNEADAPEVKDPDAVTQEPDNKDLLK